MRSILKGSTDQSVVIRIVDSTDGTPETAVVFNTPGIDLWYRREGATKTSVTEATLAALNDAHADGGFLHIGDGYYRLDLPDPAVATGADGVAVGGTVTGMVVIGCYVPLIGYNPQDAVRLGLTALPNAAAEAAGGLYTRGTGAGQINQAANGQVDANTVAINASATAADNQERAALALYRGSVTGATTTTTLIDSGLTQSATDHWKGRIVIFTTGVLAKQATDITAFDPATDKLTFTALTGAPSGADEYVIV